MLADVSVVVVAAVVLDELLVAPIVLEGVVLV
jgi:hypothetical protein